MEGSGISFKSRSHSYGGNGSINQQITSMVNSSNGGGTGDSVYDKTPITDVKTPSLTPMNHRTGSQQSRHMMKRSMQLNNIVGNNDEIIINDQLR